MYILSVSRRPVFLLAVSQWVRVQLKATNSIVLILASKEDEDEMPAASLPYAALPIILREEYFPADRDWDCVCEVLGLLQRYVSCPEEI